MKVEAARFHQLQPAKESGKLSFMLLEIMKYSNHGDHNWMP
jgi:hypothetical protein